MFESKYSKVLTIILIIVIIAIIGLLGFLAYDYYKNFVLTTDATDFVDNFQGDVDFNNIKENNNQSTNTNTNTDIFNQIQNTNTTVSDEKRTFKGFGVMGTMSIPAISFDYPILEKTTKNSLNTSVAFLYGVGVNKPGNTVINGHNYRNGMFFSNNKKLNIGDKIYITDLTGKTLTYNIYNKFETSQDDTSFYQRDTNGIPEISLSTCTDDSKARLIIFAKAEV